MPENVCRSKSHASWIKSGLNRHQRKVGVILYSFEFVFRTAYMLCYCQHSGVDLVGLKPSP